MANKNLPRVGYYKEQLLRGSQTVVFQRRASTAPLIREALCLSTSWVDFSGRRRTFAIVLALFALEAAFYRYCRS